MKSDSSVESIRFFSYYAPCAAAYGYGDIFVTGMKYLDRPIYDEA